MKLPVPKLIALFFVAAGLFFAACQSNPDPVELISLRQSGDVSFVCIGWNGVGVPLSFCPEGTPNTDGSITVGKGFELYALVSQTVSAEVAVARVSGDYTNAVPGVLDADHSNPGLTHLRVGPRPSALVTTPGGQASFVAIEEVGKEGIFGLPTSCLFGPGTLGDAGGTARDLTTWPACSLPSAPGDMVVLVDEVDGGMRARCDGPVVSSEDLTQQPAGERDECAVNLFSEFERPGARKLVVALPDEGRLVVLDAQAILNRPPASYRSCLESDVFEASIPLAVDLPARIEQVLPTDLVAPGCTDSRITYGPFAQDLVPRPAGMDASDGILLVADQGAPVIHALSDIPCALQEREPLVMTSIERPERMVTTTRVALSPATPAGKRYAYAIDERGADYASIAVFDVTAGSGARTPLVRPGSADMPLEPADRIEFASPVKDVRFALIDRALPDSDTEVAVTGVRCDPDPRSSPSSIGAEYRPSPDFTTGARPSLLRGLFAYALLGTGGLAVIDIDDFDADCRRPVSSNPLAEADFRGCVADPAGIPFYTDDNTLLGTPTVSAEMSCNVVVPHRVRSANLMNSVDAPVEGTRVPSLTSYGRLSRYGRGMLTNRDAPEGRKRPIMLGVDFESPEGGPPAPAQVYVGSTLRSKLDLTDPLVIDPNDAQVPSMVLPWKQPRAYPTSEIVTVTYEGSYAGQQVAGRLMSGGDASLAGDAAWSDDGVRFCDLGVMDARLSEQLAKEQFGLSDGSAARFRQRHTDYVQLTSRLLTEGDKYWAPGAPGAMCGDGAGFDACVSVFSEGRDDELPPSRDFTILRAFQDHLDIVPRDVTGPDAEKLVELAQCCFPDPLAYRLRASHHWVTIGDFTGFAHNVKAVKAVDPDTGEASFPCELDCNPMLAHHRSRAFELSSVRCESVDPNAAKSCRVGPFTEDDVVCSYDSGKGPVRPGGIGSDCILDAPNRRFAVYRGLEPSERDMTFAHEVGGGFAARSLSLTLAEPVSTNVVLPVSLTQVGTQPLMGVVDSQDRGLIMIDTKRLIVTSAFY